MKKVIVFSLVLAMAVGSAFAVDLGGTVFGGVRLMQGNNDKHMDGDKEVADDLTAGAGMTRIRLEGAGENDEGTFGGWLRFSTDGNFADDFGAPVAGLAWWKPIEQFKMTIGGNPDGFYGKEGTAGWMFYQMPSDIGIVDPASVWGGGYLNPDYWMYGDSAAQYRDAFYGGFGGMGLMFDIRPVDAFGVNIVVPYFTKGPPAPWDPTTLLDPRLIDVWKQTMVQFDVNLDGIGNLALTYFGTDDYAFKENDDETGIGANFRLYFNLTAIDNFGLDFGLGLRLPESTEEDFGGGKVKITANYPLAIGLGAKMDVTDSFGFKARLLAKIGPSATVDGEKKEDPDVASFVFGLDLLPYIGISDNMKLYIGLGLVMLSFPEPEVGDKKDNILGWHFNPYLQVGAEWGPTFYAGFRLFSYGDKGLTPKDQNEYTKVHFEVPIGIQVSF
jgi:hypothetical protein